jgi:hypothetical protein
MDIEFELAASRNPYRTVFAKTPFSLAGFLAAQFLLVSSQPIGFQVNESQIRIHRPRKPTVTYLRFDHWVLLSTSPMLPNAAISLVRYICRAFVGEGLIFFRQKAVVDLLLDDAMIPGKFGCICLNGVEMHKEHTYIQTFFFMYIDLCSVLLWWWKLSFLCLSYIDIVHYVN